MSLFARTVEFPLAAPGALFGFAAVILLAILAYAVACIVERGFP